MSAGEHSVMGIFLDLKPSLKVNYFTFPTAIKTSASASIGHSNSTDLK